MKSIFCKLVLTGGLFAACLLLGACGVSQDNIILVETPSDAIETKENTTRTPAGTTSPDSRDDAANADVIFVRAVQSNNGTWTFEVTISHPDTGWEDYADGWDVVTPDGKVLKPDPASTFTRLLLHPHENEQPFTRSQSYLIIPEGIGQVTVRAHDSLAGFGGQEITLDLSEASGEGYRIER